jgi:hypothetical protein
MKQACWSLLFLLLFALGGYSQDARPSQLYWVVETNSHHRNCTIVRFYNQANQKVHELKLMGVHIDIRAPKHKRRLDQLLKEYLERAAAAPLQKANRSI